MEKLAVPLVPSNWSGLVGASFFHRIVTDRTRLSNLCQEGYEFKNAEFCTVISLTEVISSNMYDEMRWTIEFYSVR